MAYRIVDDELGVGVKGDGVACRARTAFFVGDGEAPLPALVDGERRCGVPIGPLIRGKGGIYAKYCGVAYASAGGAGDLWLDGGAGFDFDDVGAAAARGVGHSNAIEAGASHFDGSCGIARIPQDGGVVAIYGEERAGATEFFGPHDVHFDGRAYGDGNGISCGAALGVGRHDQSIVAWEVGVHMYGGTALSVDA